MLRVEGLGFGGLWIRQRGVFEVNPISIGCLDLFSVDLENHWRFLSKGVMESD